MWYLLAYKMEAIIWCGWNITVISTVCSYIQDWLNFLLVWTFTHWEVTHLMHYFMCFTQLKQIKCKLIKTQLMFCIHKEPSKCHNNNNEHCITTLFSWKTDLLQNLKTTKQKPSPEDQLILSKHVGWFIWVSFQQERKFGKIWGHLFDCLSAYINLIPP